MTRKDFEVIADVLKSTRPQEHWNANKLTQWNMDVCALAKRFELINPRFNSVIFYKACGGLFLSKDGSGIAV